MGSKRFEGKIQIGMYHIEWDASDKHNDHIIITDMYGNKNRVCGGDVETVLSCLFIKSDIYREGE